MALYLTAMVKKKSFLNHAMQLKLNTLVHSLSFRELSVQDITYASAVDVSSVLVYCYHPLPYRSSLTLYQWTWHGGLNLSWSWMI